MLLYGDSGNGKSSLINAGLLPDATRLGFRPERLRVQPRTGEEVVIERIATGDDDAEYLPSLLAPQDDDSSRVVLSTEAFGERVRAACKTHRPLLVFDQFEEILTLFEDARAGEARRRLVELLVTLLHEPLPVKLLFAFREDHLGKVKQILAASPELVDQALRLGPPAPDALPAIIRGPFERYHLHHANEELLIVLEGRPRLRTPEGTRTLEAGAVVAFPPGPDGAHRISNAGPEPARVLVCSTMRMPEVAEYPDTGTWLAMTGVAEGKVFPAGTDISIAEARQSAMEASATHDDQHDSQLPE